MVTAKTRTKIIDTLMTLAAERRFEDVTLDALAEGAGLSLADLRGAYDSRLDVLLDFARQLDERVLAGADPAMAAEAPRERLFDVLFSRLEALAPHKAAIRNIARAARRDPALALALNGMTVASMAWMLTAAGIDATGGRGLAKAQGLTLAYARVMRVWLDDDDPGLARTMAALDKRLREAERAMLRLERLKRAVRRLRPRRERRDETPAEEGDLPEGHPS